MRPEAAELWSSLIEDIKPTPGQFLRLLELSQVDGPFPALHELTESCDNMLDRLEELVSDKNVSLDSEMAKIRKILSARQSAKFILWIEHNPAFMQLLEAIWPHPRLET